MDVMEATEAMQMLMVEVTDMEPLATPLDFHSTEVLVLPFDESMWIADALREHPGTRRQNAVGRLAGLEAGKQHGMAWAAAELVKQWWMDDFDWSEL